MPRKPKAKPTEPVVPLAKEERDVILKIKERAVSYLKRHLKDNANRPRRMRVDEWIYDHEFLLGRIEPLIDEIPDNVAERIESIRNRVDDVKDNFEFRADETHWFPLKDYCEEITFLLMVLAGKGSSRLAAEADDEAARSRVKTASQMSMELMGKSG